MLKNLFGGKKDNAKAGYYLQVDEKVDEKESAPEADATEAPAAASAPAPTKTSKKKSTSKTAIEPVAAVKPAQWDAPDWVKDLLASSKSNGAGNNSSDAGEPVVVISQPRRRPGPSLTPFMNMAKEVNKK